MSAQMMSGTVYPSDPASGAYAVHGSGPQLAANALDPQRAANLMSPVGHQYPDRDWDAAAAMPARALPPWMLAILFVGAIAIALTLTIVIARIAR